VALIIGGIVDQHIEVAQFLRQFRHHALQIGDIGDIAMAK